MVLERFRLDGQVALVTGASRGLGKASALALAEAGADCVVSARGIKDLEQTATAIQALGRKALPVKVDVTNPREVEAMVEEALKAFGKLDILVNCAGIAHVKPLLEVSVEDWTRVLDTNLNGIFLCSKAVGAHMVERRSGRIINVASIAGFLGSPHLAPYAASKGGVLQLTRSLAIEWARYNIRVNAICPGYFLTAMNEAFFATREGQEYIKRWIPMRRLGRPEELGGIVVFLASEASSFVTGAAFVIDGGQSVW